MEAPMVQENTSLRCKNLHSYLQTLSPSVLDKLYCHSATCMAVFRELPELAKLYVMRLLFVDQPVRQAVVSQWVTNKHNASHTDSSDVLSALRVWYEQQMPGGMSGWVLNPIFRDNLKASLLRGNSQTEFTAWASSAPLPSDKYTRDAAFLDNYARDRWECIVKFMVGVTEASEGVSSDIVDVILEAGLKRGDTGDTDLCITPAGFQFILMDVSTQVWHFVLQYLVTIQRRGLNLIDCLCFLFQLSFSTLGKDYSTEGMSDTLQTFLQHLREIGLVYQRKRKSQRFSPTQLAINLVSGVSHDRPDKHRHGYIVVETNYRVYAYTDSPVHIALIGLFCDMLYRFPNLAVGNISRESVRAALTRGITADQIINFLYSHAHKEMLRKKPVLPPTITDQIKLWELERDRFKFSHGVLYGQFLSQSDFELLEDYAKELGVLVWSSRPKRVMVVTKEGHDDVKRFWKRQKPDR